MTETVYETLNNEWLAQREKYQQWHHLLSSAGVQLKSGLTEKLGVSGKTWEEWESKKKREYVELASLRSQESTTIKSIYDEDITEIGELPFGILVTFEYEPKSYPKASYKLPVVVRINDGQARFSFWDTVENTQEPMATWLDIEQMLDALVARLEEHFAFDPLVGHHVSVVLGSYKMVSSSHCASSNNRANSDCPIAVPLHSAATGCRLRGTLDSVDKLEPRKKHVSKYEFSSNKGRAFFNSK